MCASGSRNPNGCVEHRAVEIAREVAAACERFVRRAGRRIATQSRRDDSLTGVDASRCRVGTERGCGEKQREEHDFSESKRGTTLLPRPASFAGGNEVFLTSAAKREHNR